MVVVPKRPKVQLVHYPNYAVYMRDELIFDASNLGSEV